MSDHPDAFPKSTFLSNDIFDKEFIPSTILSPAFPKSVFVSLENSIILSIPKLFSAIRILEYSFGFPIEETALDIAEKTSFNVLPTEDISPRFLIFLIPSANEPIESANNFAPAPIIKTAAPNDKSASANNPTPAAAIAIPFTDAASTHAAPARSAIATAPFHISGQDTFENSWNALDNIKTAPANAIKAMPVATAFCANEVNPPNAPVALLIPPEEFPRAFAASAVCCIAPDIDRKPPIIEPIPPTIFAATIADNAATTNHILSARNLTTGIITSIKSLTPFITLSKNSAPSAESKKLCAISKRGETVAAIFSFIIVITLLNLSLIDADSFSRLSVSR